MSALCQKRTRAAQQCYSITSSARTSNEGNTKSGALAALRLAVGADQSALSACRRGSDDADCDFVNRIVAVAEPVPFGMFGLNSARTVHCARTQHSWPGSVDARHQFPSAATPAGLVRRSIGLMPSAARVDFDPFNRSHT